MLGRQVHDTRALAEEHCVGLDKEGLCACLTHLREGFGQTDYANDFVGSPTPKVCSLATL